MTDSTIKLPPLVESRINHNELEIKWQNIWLEEKTYKSTIDNRPKFTMVMPPPNITGILHMGHALNNTYQDTIARAKRNQGYNVCWVPGTDHAGIATQVKVQKELSSKGIDVSKLTKEELIEHIQTWKKSSGSTIINQLKRLGCSCDWERECFTMNEKFSSHVKDIFVKLYNDKLIYQGEYMINWDPVLQTAIADDEVEIKPIKSKLYYIRYYNAAKTNFIVIATSRPETIFGDVAIAYNEQDERYNKMGPDTYFIPLTQKTINLIPDSQVNRDFGTGLVKLTPAHDKFDFELSQKHGLKPIQVIDKNLNICNTNTIYDGMHINKARKHIVNELDANGYLEKIESYDSIQKICYRSGAQVESLITIQWFVDMEKLAHLAAEAVNSGEIKLYPENKINQFNNWIQVIKPWCISRQLAWGHQIPIYNCVKCSHQLASCETVNTCPLCDEPMTQDKDVLDTWFSSWLYPWGVFDADELEYYFPTDILITGCDILFFWVIRMIVASKYTMNKIPFSKVYLHGIVRDETNKKMSKSLGNVIDPLDLINKYGCDPVRFTLLMKTPYDADISLAENSIADGCKFCTKFWNIFRFTQTVIIENPAGYYIDDDIAMYNIYCIKDQEVINRYLAISNEIYQHLDEFEFSKAARKLYTWIWDYLGNDYLEYIKDKLNTRKQLMLFLIYKTIELAHPFIPHITSEMRQILRDTITYFDIKNKNIAGNPN